MVKYVTADTLRERERERERELYFNEIKINKAMKIALLSIEKDSNIVPVEDTG